MGGLHILAIVLVVMATVQAGDMMRKSIVFNKSTPDVFYCPQKKATGVDKMMVTAKPLSKLCEFDGKPLPSGYKSDCYGDVDETDYACKEKRRIMKRLHPPGLELLEEAESKHWRVKLRGKSSKSHHQAVRS